MKKISLVASLTALAFSQNSYALMAQTQIASFGFTHCWETVVVTAWTGAAEQAFDSIDKTFQNSLKLIDQTRVENNKAITSAISEMGKTVQSTLLEINQREIKQKIKNFQLENALDLDLEVAYNNYIKMLRTKLKPSKIDIKGLIDGSIEDSKKENEALKKDVDDLFKMEEANQLTAYGSEEDVSINPLLTDSGTKSPGVAMFMKYCNIIKKEKQEKEAKKKLNEITAIEEVKSSEDRMTSTSIEEKAKEDEKKITKIIKANPKALTASAIFAPEKATSLSGESVTPASPSSAGSVAKKDTFTLSQDEVEVANSYKNIVCYARKPLMPSASDSSYYSLAYYQKNAMDALCENTFSDVIAERSPGPGGKSEIFSLKEEVLEPIPSLHGQPDIIYYKNKFAQEVLGAKLLIKLYKKLERIEVVDASILAQMNNSAEVKKSFDSCKSGKGC